MEIVQNIKKRKLDQWAALLEVNLQNVIHRCISEGDYLRELPVVQYNNIMDFWHVMQLSGSWVEYSKHPHIKTKIFQVRLNRFLYKIGICSSFRLSRFQKISFSHL